jgi:hypothetical protein
LPSHPIRSLFFKKTENECIGYSLIPGLHLCVLIVDETGQVGIQKLPVGRIGERKAIAFEGTEQGGIEAEMVDVGEAIVIETERQKTDRDRDSFDTGDRIVLEPELDKVVGQGRGKYRKDVMVQSQMSQSGREGEWQNSDSVVGGNEGVEAGGQSVWQTGNSVSVNGQDLQRGREHRRQTRQAVAAGIQNFKRGREICRKALQ